MNPGDPLVLGANGGPQGALTAASISSSIAAGLQQLAGSIAKSEGTAAASGSMPASTNARVAPVISSVIPSLSTPLGRKPTASLFSPEVQHTLVESHPGMRGPLSPLQDAAKAIPKYPGNGFVMDSRGPALVEKKTPNSGIVARKGSKSFLQDIPAPAALPTRPDMAVPEKKKKSRSGRSSEKPSEKSEEAKAAGGAKASHASQDPHNPSHNPAKGTGVAGHGDDDDDQLAVSYPPASSGLDPFSPGPSFDYFGGAPRTPSRGDHWGANSFQLNSPHLHLLSGGRSGGRNPLTSPSYLFSPGLREHTVGSSLVSPQMDLPPPSEIKPLPTTHESSLFSPSDSMPIIYHNLDHDGDNASINGNTPSQLDNWFSGENLPAVSPPPSTGVPMSLQATQRTRSAYNDSFPTVRKSLASAFAADEDLEVAFALTLLQSPPKATKPKAASAGSASAPAASSYDAAGTMQSPPRKIPRSSPRRTSRDHSTPSILRSGARSEKGSPPHAVEAANLLVTIKKDTPERKRSMNSSSTLTDLNDTLLSENATTLHFHDVSMKDDDCKGPGAGAHSMSLSMDAADQSILSAASVTDTPGGLNLSGSAGPRKTFSRMPGTTSAKETVQYSPVFSPAKRRKGVEEGPAKRQRVVVNHFPLKAM